MKLMPAPRRRFFHSTFVMIVCVGIAIFAWSGIVNQYAKERAYRERVSVREQELVRARTAHDALAAQVALSESVYGRESYARQMFDVVRPGETLIILPDDIATSSTYVSDDHAPVVTSESWFEKLRWWGD